MPQGEIPPSLVSHEIQQYADNMRRAGGARGASSRPTQRRQRIDRPSNRRSQADRERAERDPEYKKNLEDRERKWEEERRAEGYEFEGDGESEPIEVDPTTPTKRPATTPETPPATPKVARPHSTNTNLEASTSHGSEANNTGGMNPDYGSSLPGGSGADVRGVKITDHDAAPVGSLRFAHTFQIQTPAIQFKQFANAAKYVPTGAKLLSTPLVTVDPNTLALYMTPQEFSDLPTHSWAETCHIKCTPLGYRAPFATNDPSSSFANSQTIVQAVHAVGLNKIFNCVVSPYKVADATPTVGTPDTTATLPGGDELYNSSANCGEPIWWNSFTSIMMANGDNYPNLLKYIQVQNVNDTKGVPLINYEYNFKSSRLKLNNTSAQTRNTYHGIVPEAVNPVGFGLRNADWNKTTGATYRTAGITSGGNLSDPSSLFTYKTGIEKSWWTQNNFGNSQTPDAPPLIGIGTMPVSTQTKIDAYTYSPLMIIWQIECMLHVRYNINYTVPNVPRDIIQSWDPNILEWFSADDVNSQIAFLSVSGRRLTTTRAAAGPPTPTDFISVSSAAATANNYRFPLKSDLPA